MSQNECGNHLLMLKMIHVAPLKESTVLSDLLAYYKCESGKWHINELLSDNNSCYNMIWL